MSTWAPPVVSSRVRPPSGLLYWYRDRLYGSLMNVVSTRTIRSLPRYTMFGLVGSTATASEWFPPAGPFELLWVNRGSAVSDISRTLVQLVPASLVTYSPSKS